MLNRFVDSIDAGVVIDLQSLIVSQPAEQWLRSVRSLGQRGTKNEDVLVKERHLNVRV